MSSLIARIRKRMRIKQGMNKKADFVFFDEVSSLPIVFDKAIEPKTIECCKCGAQPNERCTRWRRTKRGKRKQYRGGYHPNRKHDANLATQAWNALT